MLLAERAGRKLERRSNPAPRGMTVTLAARPVHRIRPIGLLHISYLLACGCVQYQLVEDRFRFVGSHVAGNGCC